jgi:propionyl-CoA synthetase
MFVAGEHCDSETMNWIKKITKKPTFDHWWQTETGWPISSMVYKHSLFLLKEI